MILLQLLLLLLLSLPPTYSSHLKINVTERYHTFDVTKNNDKIGRVVQVVQGRTSLMATPIFVNEDEVVETTVRNRMYSKSLTIHHHGLHQHGTPWMDGVPGLSQTLIAPGSDMVYKFLAHPAGTHFYHTHVAQLGLRGPFIVRAKEDPHVSLYDSDENVVFLSDLSKSRDESIWLAGLVSGALMSEEDPESDLDWEDTVLLINGVVAPQVVLQMVPGVRPRLRLINGAFNWAVKLSIESHAFLILATDGKDVEPRSTSILVLSPGERYDVVLLRTSVQAPAEPSGYAVRLRTRNGHQVTARLQYGTTGSDNTVVKVDSLSDNHVNDIDLSYNTTLLRAHSTTPLMPSMPSRTMALRLGGNMKTYEWTIDGVAWSLDDLGINTPLSLLQGVYSQKVRNVIKQVDLNEVVDIELNNLTGMQHPFHLHGHKFWILGSRSVDDALIIQPVNPEDRPAFKDTINVPPKRVVTIRVKFDNPGPWLFHCHTSFHLNRGMAVVFVVGNAAQQPIPPIIGGNNDDEEKMHVQMITMFYVFSGLFLGIGMVSGYAISRLTRSRRSCFKGYTPVVHQAVESPTHGGGAAI